MPYIAPQDRAKFGVLYYAPQTAGELNYAITLLIRDYAYGTESRLSYQRINDVLGALEGAKLEFVRRVVNPYENAKMAANGDVYE